MKPSLCGLSSVFIRKFSLIELLICISIIAILAGMFLPMLNSVRKKGLGSSCLGRIRQVNMFLSLYADSHDDYLPPRGFFAEGGVPGSWYDMLKSSGLGNELKNAEAFRCPSLPVRKDHGNVHGDELQLFGLNIWITGKGSVKECIVSFVKRSGMCRKRNDFSAQRPSDQVLLADSIYTTYSGAFGTGSSSMVPVQYLGIGAKRNVSGNGAVHFRHGENSSFGMLDGSAAGMRFQSAYWRSNVTAGILPGLIFHSQQLK